MTGGHLRKRLGAVDLMSFGISIVIGTGIFTLTGIAPKDLAVPGVVVSFLLAGFVSLLAALCYAELSSAVPAAGRRTSPDCPTSCQPPCSGRAFP